MFAFCTLFLESEKTIRTHGQGEMSNLHIKHMKAGKSQIYHDISEKQALRCGKSIRSEKRRQDVKDKRNGRNKVDHRRVVVVPGMNMGVAPTSPTR